MAAAAAPRLTGGVIASVLFHGGLVAAFIVLRPPVPPPAPPVYRVQLIAAPAVGERTVGVVQPAPQTPPVESPPPPQITKTVTPRPTVPTPKPKAAPIPKAATANAAPKPPEAKKAEPQPTATSDAGGKGADVSNIDTNGLEFPYPWYTTNVVSLILRQFRSAARYTAEVRFVIQRDGTVDPSSIKIVTSSGNYTFDTQALGAIEAASRNKAMGALPPGFREDILPVTFRFSPSVGR